MSGPIPKDPQLRQRANKVATRAQLEAEPAKKRNVPRLPDRVDGEGQPMEWQAMTKDWWRDVWRSPMAAEYLQADVHGLYRLAVLVDKYWIEPTTTLAAEIRLQQQCFGLTPIDRRRLQWEVKRVEAVTSKKHIERQETPAQIEDDPRKVLRLVG